MKIILLVIMACNSIVEYKVQFPDGSEFSTTHPHNEKVRRDIGAILQTRPRIIIHNETKGICN